MNKRERDEQDLNRYTLIGLHGDETVLCDFCDKNGDAYDINPKTGEKVYLEYGGGLISSYAVCQECLDEFLTKHPNAEVEICDKSRTFGDNCRISRMGTYGTDELYIIIEDI